MKDREQGMDILEQETENRQQEFDRLKEEYRNVTPPAGGVELVQEAVWRAKKEKEAVPRGRVVHWRRYGAAAAAALVVLAVTPNLSPAAAAAMERIPVIGGLVKVVTVRDYQADGEHYQAEARIPQVIVEGQTPAAVEELNQTAEGYIDTLVSQFKQDIASAPEGHQGLDVDYQVVTDTASWFTLKLSVLETQASGYQQARYYHINKATGQIAHLKDLFKPEADYRAAISEDIKQQMRRQMEQDGAKTFFLDDPEAEGTNFTQIGEDQNFYFNDGGELVISFDEYAVAPGYMGVQEFVIPNEVTEGLRQ